MNPWGKFLHSTKTGRIVYSRTKHTYSVRDVWRISVSLSTQPIEHAFADPTFLLKLMGIYSTWCKDRGLLQKIDSGTLLEDKNAYLEFIKWFDTVMEWLKGALQALDVLIPELKSFTSLVSSSISIYEDVRENFPLE